MSKRNWTAPAQRSLRKKAQASDMADRATLKVTVDKTKLRDEAEQAIREFRNRRNTRMTLDDFLRRKS